MTALRTVAIIQRAIPHYRIPFFKELCAQGRSRGLEIIVFAGASSEPFTSSFPFSHRLMPVRCFRHACWIWDLKRALVGADIIVAPQELHCLTVPYLWVLRKRLCRHWIWWGHGYNHQAALRPGLGTPLKEAAKAYMTKRADGLLAYTLGAARFWHARGLAEARVIPYYNTIDVEGLRLAARAITEQDLAAERHRLGLASKSVLLYSGRLHAEKQVDFLLHAFAVLKAVNRQVALLIIGDGSERASLQRLAERLHLQDVHFLGEIRSSRSAYYFKMADLLVLPSLVGLAVVHGFAFGLPLVTTEHPGHGPELEYCTDQNGVITRHDPSEYAHAIDALLRAPFQLASMKQSAMEQGQRLKLNDSVQRFLRGIESLSFPAQMAA